MSGKYYALRVEDAINLKNARSKKYNDSMDESIRLKTEGNKKLTSQEQEYLNGNGKLGMIKDNMISILLYPESSKGSRNTSMFNIKNGNMEKIGVEWVGTISEACGVDANFLFGMPSKHDKDFQKLVLNIN